MQVELKKLKSEQESQPPYRSTYSMNEVIQQVKKDPEAQSIYEYAKIPVSPPMIRDIYWTAKYIGNGEWVARVTYYLWDDYDKVKGDIYQQFISEWRFYEQTRETKFIEFREL